MRPERIEVHKFGGTSVGSWDRIAHVADLVTRVRARTGLIVVASAMTKVTDALLAAARAAAEHEREHAMEILQELRIRHREALAQLAADDSGTAIAIDSLLTEAGELIGASVQLGELSARTRDRLVATGEKLSVRLIAARLRDQGQQAVAVDADTFLDTDDNFGEASPLQGVAHRTTASALMPLLERGVTPIVTGFCGRAPDGGTTTLGRGGSDFTATFLAGALDADEVTIWTDVDGVFTADPRMVAEARVIRQLNFREAAELSYYGAKVLHQRTMIPVARKRIPVVTRNSMNPEAPGTVVDGRFTPGSHPVKAISAIRNHCLISVEGKGMAGVPGVAARVFGCLARKDISVTMISQSSSESSICFAAPADSSVDAEATLKHEFRRDISHGDIEEITVRQNVGLVAAVGLGMAQSVGVAGRVLSAVADRGVNVLAIAQGSSELNISIACDESQVPDAVRTIHEEFGLNRIDTGVDSTRGFDLMLLGCGNIGRALVEMVLDRHAHLFERFGLRAQIVAIADRSGFICDPAGLSLAALEEILDQKARGETLATAGGGRRTANASEMVAHMLDYRLARPVLVDVSNAPDAETFETAFRLGADVVTANKNPLAGSMADYKRLLATATDNRCRLRAEATVGAGLPVIDTLEMLVATGDTLHRARGCLSGTLGFVMHRIEQGAKLSEAVREAVEQGFTEPDPYVDLSGGDVARKAIIVGRISGLVNEDVAVELEGLVPASLAGLSRDAFLEALTDFDGPMAEKAAAAAAEQKVLRYVATIQSNKMTVGPVAVPIDSPLGMLKGTDNMIVFESDRYSTRPLVVSGPGAGIDVTAMGVLGDILRIAAERGPQ